MREISVNLVTEVVERLCIEANTHLPGDVKCAIESCRACEDGGIAQGVLDKIIENYNIADRENVPICQDTGMACVFLEIGQDVHFVDGNLTEDPRLQTLADLHNISAGYLSSLFRKETGSTLTDYVNQSFVKFPRYTKRNSTSQFDDREH